MRERESARERESKRARERESERARESWVSEWGGSSRSLFAAEVLVNLATDTTVKLAVGARKVE